ncbi:hypothetical protein [Nocardia sp. BMG51109]|uniref:hypothetical protein n=1 Tax=Nocardia sp. BMG51109 TaxID=1056816 RepID=UPI0004632A4F|nr:hypothetical protein [Nocardia sp. BMG51109]
MTNHVTPADPVAKARAAGEQAFMAVESLRRSEARHHREIMAMLQELFDRAPQAAQRPGQR